MFSRGHKKRHHRDDHSGSPASESSEDTETEEPPPPLIGPGISSNQRSETIQRCSSKYTCITVSQFAATMLPSEIVYGGGKDEGTPACFISECLQKNEIQTVLQWFKRGLLYRIVSSAVNSYVSALGSSATHSQGDIHSECKGTEAATIPITVKCGRCGSMVFTGGSDVILGSEAQLQHLCYNEISTDEITASIPLFISFDKDIENSCNTGTPMSRDSVFALQFDVDIIQLDNSLFAQLNIRHCLLNSSSDVSEVARNK